MRTKTFDAQVKADTGDLGDGQFRALVSVFGNVDSMGDVVMPGAFTETLADWAKSGAPIPVIWSHDWVDPYSHLGHVVTATETDAGLEVVGQLDLDNTKAQQVNRLLKGRRVKQFSFAYDVEDGGFAERDGRDVYELRKLKVHEVGPCLIGANQETDLLAAAKAWLATADAQKIADMPGVAAYVDAQIAKTAPTPGEEQPEEPESGQPDGPAASDEEPQPAKSPARPAVKPAQRLGASTIHRLLEETSC